MIIGHISQQQKLLEAIRNKALHHTLLFTGNESIGKKKVALGLAEIFFCEPYKTTDYTSKNTTGCGSCSGCKMSRAGNNPDIITVTCSDKESGSTKNIRTLLSTLRLKPFSGDKRVIILDDVHALRGEGANALLKSLEEPKPGTYFILISHKPQFILPTIHSRAQRWGFNALTAQELKEIVSITFEETPIVPGLLQIADGSVHKYLLLTDQDSAIDEYQKQLIQIVKGDKRIAMEFGESLGSNKAELPSAITILTLIARAHLRNNRHTLQWSRFVSDLGELPHLFFSRNFAPQYILQTILLRLSQNSTLDLLQESFFERFVSEI